METTEFIHNIMKQITETLSLSLPLVERVDVVFVSVAFVVCCFRLQASGAMSLSPRDEIRNGIQCVFNRAKAVRCLAHQRRMFYETYKTNDDDASAIDTIGTYAERKKGDSSASVEYATDANECNSKTQSNEKLMSIRVNLSCAPFSTSSWASSRTHGSPFEKLSFWVSATVTVCYMSASRSNMNASFQFFLWPSRSHWVWRAFDVCAMHRARLSSDAFSSLARFQRFLFSSVRHDMFSLLFSCFLFLLIRLSFAIFYRSVIFYQFVFNTACLFPFSPRFPLSPSSALSVPREKMLKRRQSRRRQQFSLQTESKSWRIFRLTTEMVVKLNERLTLV